MAIRHKRVLKTLALDMDALERARIAMGLLRKDVAQKAGVGTVAVWRAFSGVPVGVKVARAICGVLKLSPIPWVEAEPQAARTGTEG